MDSPPQDHTAPHINRTRPIALAILGVIFIPLWLASNIQDWIHPYQHDTETTAALLSVNTYAELELSQAAESQNLPTSILSLTGIQTLPSTLKQEIELHEHFQNTHPKENYASQITLATLYLITGEDHKAYFISKNAPDDYFGIIITLSLHQPLTPYQLDSIQEYRNYYPSSKDPAIWITLNNNILNKTKDPAIPPAPQKLTARLIFSAIGYICIIIAIVLLLKNRTKLLPLPTAAISPHWLTGILIFITADYIGDQIYNLPFLFIDPYSLDSNLPYLIADTIFRIAPAAIALTYLATLGNISNLFKNANHTLLTITLAIGISIPVYYTLDHFIRPHLEEDFYTGIDALLYGNWALPMEILSAVILAPICEEIVFRGLLLTSLQNKLGNLAAILISSAIFALIHYYDIISTIDVFVFGIVMAITFLKTRSLVPCIIAHACFNLWLTADTWFVYLRP